MMDRDLSTDSMFRLEDICTTFEESLSTGRNPKIEVFLKMTNAENRSVLFRDLLTLELEYHSKSGKPIEIADYQSRFRTQADTVTDLIQSMNIDCATFSQNCLETVKAPGWVPDQQIGKYTVKQLLGEGQFGSVYLAFDRDLERYICIKTPKVGVVWTRGQIRALRTEARKVAKLDHPNIVAVYDFSDDHPAPFIVMQFVHGGSLKNRLNGSPQPIEFVVELVGKIADAVHHAHLEGLIHRDLKPANILMDIDDNPRVTDFGLAIYQSDRLNRIGEFAGTVSYMSPEQIDGKTILFDKRGDIWALGVILYELLTGQRPFQGDAFVDIKDNILKGRLIAPATLNDRVSADLEGVCLKALARHPAERYRTADDFAKALRASCTIEKSKRFRKLLWLASVAAILVLCIGIAGANKFRNDAKEASRIHVNDQIAKLFKAKIEHVPEIVKDIRPHMHLIETRLLKELQNRDDVEKQTRARLALISHHPDQAEFLFNRIFDAKNQEYQVILSALKQFDPGLKNRLVTSIESFGLCNTATTQGIPRDVSEVISKSQGCETNEFVVCQQIEFRELGPLIEKLETTDFRPHRIRIYKRLGQLFAAAIWIRDGVSWEFEKNLTRKRLLELDNNLRKKGYHLTDVSPHPFGQHRERFVGVWAKSDATTIQADPNLDLNPSMNPTDTPPQFDATPAFDLCQLLKTENLQRSRYTFGIQNEIRPTYFDTLPDLQTDICINKTVVRNAEQDWLFERKRLSKRLLANRKGDASAWMMGAQSDFYSDRNDLAISGFTRAIDESSERPIEHAYALRAIASAKAGNVNGSQIDCNEYLTLIDRRKLGELPPAVLEMWLRCTIDIYLGKIDESLAYAEQVIAQNPTNHEYLIYGACIYATAFEVSRNNLNSPVAKFYAVKAIEKLRIAISNGFSNRNRLFVIPELQPIRSQSEFWQLFPNRNSLPNYCATWQSSEWFESATLANLTPDVHFENANILIAQGYAPVSISIAEIHESEKLVCASVWHRLQDRAISRIANLAVELLAMDEPNHFWNLVRDCRDDRLKNGLIESLANSGIDPNAVLSQIDVEQDSSLRRAYCIYIGSLPRNRLAEIDMTRLSQKILEMYANDPDPGIHGAAYWVLKKLKLQHLLMSPISVEMQPEHRRESRWFETMGGHTMCLVVPSDDVWISRARGPNWQREMLSSAHLEHQYAMSSTEVTVGQFRHFDPSFSPGLPPSYPAVGISLYRAVEYCNWLSREESLPEFYDLVPEENSEFRIADIHSNNGFRLPTELEWEFAARGGNFTNRLFGQSNQRIGAVSWHSGNSNRRIQSVGMLRPNSIGLFDMLGNALEWTGDAVSNSDNIAPPKWPMLINNRQKYAVRGASYVLVPDEHRFEFRASFLPTAPRGDQGFRITRTVLKKSTNSDSR